MRERPALVSRWFDRFYHFYINEHRKQCVLYGSAWCLGMGYMAVNVFLRGRPDGRVLVEALALVSLLPVVVAALYCYWDLHDRE